MEARLEKSRTYMATHREERSEYYQRWYEANRESKLAKLYASYDELRIAVFGYYGTSCACCQSDKDLTIDHVNGTGRQHRIELYGKAHHGGVHFYRWLANHGFPDGYQTLCRPCNSSKQRGDQCRLEHEIK